MSLIATSILVVSFAQRAKADTTPPVGTPATVSADPLPTVQIDGVVWSQVTVGNTVYATGSFDKAWPAGQAEGGPGTVSVGNLIAYNITTGVMVSSFNHVLNAQGLAITASPNGSLVYVGGDFTTVDGVARGHVAAFDTATGALDTAWTPNVYSEVAAISANASTVYLGGQFFQVDGQTRTRLAAVTATTGALLSWAPSADDAAVSSLLVSPDGSTVDVGGRFSTLNGVEARGSGAVSAATGATLPFTINTYIQDYGDGSEVTSLSTDGTNGYLTAYTYKGQGGTGDFEGTAAFNPDTGAVVWIDDCHGDSYDAYPIGQILYSVSHAHDCSAVGDWPDPNPRVWHRSLAETTYATGTDTGPDTYGWNYNGQPDSTVLNWFPALTAGTFTGQGQAAWSVTGNASYVAEGGEFPLVNNVAQQGLVRFAVSSIAPNKTGPLANTAAMTPTVVSLSPGTARVAWTTTWDYDNAVLTYKVFRDGSGTPIYTTTAASNFWQVSSLGFTDTGLTPGSTHTYLVRAYDPYGNTTNGASTSVTIASSTQGGAYVGQVRADGASNLWRLDEPTGTTAYDWAGYTDLTTTAGVTGGAPGPLTGDPVTADTFTGTATSTAAVSQLAPAPTTFTIEGWVKTTTKTGGTIIDYADNPTALSTTQDNTVPNDRTLYMDNAGHILFGVVNATTATKKTITSTATYNNGAYHYVVATLSSAGMQLFVDGQLAARDQTTTTATATEHNGYWRLGGDTLSGWTAAPSSNYFAGTIADVAIYPTALSLPQVQTHYTDAGYTLAIPAAPSDAYGSVVYADVPDLYWRLDDTTGTVAADASRNGNPGTYTTTGVTKGVTGAIGSGTAVTFDGITGNVASTTQFTNPQVYSEELWFKTTSTTGGKLIGFGNAKTGLSSTSDRQIYMTNAGQLAYEVTNGSAVTITSPASYNNGSWHYVVATQGPDGMTLYVDGVTVAHSANNTAQTYNGYWRVGGDKLPAGAASSNYFAGTIDEVAVYPTELSATRVLVHYQAINGGQPPVAVFTPTCTYLACSFSAGASTDADGTISSYSWNFGDGTTATGVTATHTFTAAGSYLVTLSVTDNHNLTTVTSQTLVVAAPPNQPPVALFTPSCTLLSCTVNAGASYDPDGTVAGYAWNFGDGTTATGVTASHTYSAGGPYTISLTVTDNDGATTSIYQTITVSALYASDSFSRTVTTGWGSADFGGPWTTAGTESVVPGAGSITIAKAGGTSSAYLPAVSQVSSDTTATLTTAQAPTGGGVYMVVLGRRVSSTVDYRARLRLLSTGVVGISLLSENAGTETVLAGEQTLTGITYTPGMQFNVRLQVTGTSPTTLNLKVWPVGQPQPATWQLTATNSAAALQVPGSVGVLSYVSGSATNAPVSMLVSSFASGPVVANQPPVAAFTPSCTNLSCSFTAAASTDPDGTIASYAWTFGNGATATGVAPSYTYAGGGTYNVTLTVTDNLGATGTTSQAVTVTPAVNVPPVAAFVANCAATTCGFNGSTSYDPDGTVVSYAWNFGDGSTGAGPEPTHTYSSAGNYIVSLIVTDNGGATSPAVTQTVNPTVASVPVAVFTPTCSALTCSFDGTGSSSTGGATITAWSWNFGDGTAATGATPAHVYPAAGDYTTTLTVTDSNGITATTSQVITVRPPANPNTALFVNDTFNRTVTNGFGTADLGGAWTATGSASSMAVTPGAATLLMSKATSAPGGYLASVSSSDTDVYTTVSLNKISDGGGTTLYVIGRHTATNEEYRVQINVSSTGAVAVSIVKLDGSASAVVLVAAKTIAGLTYSPGAQLGIRFDATGTSPTTLRARVWLTSGAEPTTWTVTGTDSSPLLQAAGSVGLAAYLSGSSTKAPVTETINAFQAGPTNTPPVAIFNALCTSLTCTLNAVASTDRENNIASYTWSFGDGVTATGVTASHTFAAAGTYRITLTVTDATSLTSVVTQTVTVSP